MPTMSAKASLLGFGLAAFARGGQAMCPTGLDPYSSEPSPFGWPVTPAEFTYAHPECWAEKYAQCGGKRQSPMNLDFQLPDAVCSTKVMGSAGNLAENADYKVIPGHPTVSISKYMRGAAVSGDLGTLTLKDAAGADVEYEATDAYLTAGGLHTVNGTVADAELIIVHKPKGAEDGLRGSVVVSVLFREGAAGSPLFAQMGFPAEDASPGYEVGATWKAPRSIDLPSTVRGAMQGTSYSYSGSVPAPPCSATVHYVVLATEQPVSAAQVAKLKATLTAHAGGYLKRPAVDRVVGGECREIAVNSLVVEAPSAGSACAAASDLTSSCWAETCGLSPIDIQAAAAESSMGPTSAGELMAYKPTDHVTVSPSTYTLDAAGDFGGLMINGRLFEAKKISVKAISQHTFEGKHHAAELVVEHALFGEAMGASHAHRRLEVESEQHGDSHHGASSEAHTVMLSVPLKLGHESPLLRALGVGEEANKAAIRDGNAYAAHGAVDLGAELREPAAKGWYWYSGGRTAPGACPAWGVKWVVMEEPLEVSIEQLNFLALRVSGVDSTVLPAAAAAAAAGPRGPAVFAAAVPRGAVEEGGWAGEAAVCDSGKAQSPINIESAQVGKVGADKFLAKASWKPVSGLRVVNKGDHLAMASEQMGYFTLTGPNGYPKFYQVTDVRLRMPSEHMVDGKQYPAELQVVHKNQKTVLELEDDDVLISSFLFDIGDESKLLKQILPAQIPHKDSYATISKPVDLMWALGPAMDGAFYSYAGSHTTPGCEEAAKWVVFETAMTLSMEQYQAFKAAFPGHSTNRPVQPLNGRMLSKSTIEEYEAVDQRYFLNREMGRDRAETYPGYILFPIIGTVTLCSVMMLALFQREDKGRRETSAGGMGGEQASVIGKGYGRF